MKKSFVLLFSLLLTTAIYAQWCGTDQHVHENIASDPSYKQAYDAFYSQSPSTSIRASRSSRALHIIPVVVHVIHNNGNGNISYEQVVDGIDVLNEDFRRLNSDTANTRNVFKPFAADMEIEFRLAKYDPDGNCTNGVVRINNPNATTDADNSVKNVTIWPTNRYLNVWLVNNIASFGNSSGTILGYAQFPFGNWNTYGIVQRQDTWGRIGTSNADGRTASHEVGHCLGLFHTFQGSCGGNCDTDGDRVCDTPPSSTATYGCNNNQNSCSTDQNGPSVFNSDVVDQIENYMSYDNCQNMFSQGQKARAKGFLNSIPELVNLTSQQNLNATGVLLPDNFLCSAEFSAEQTVICAGNSVRFEDKSFFGVTSYEWSFDGGFPATDTNQSPLIRYDRPGTYNVTLKVKNSSDSIVLQKNNYITVLPAPGTFMPFTESFESTTSLLANNWYQYSEDNYGWRVTSDASTTGSQSLLMYNYFNSSNTAYNVYSPSYDLSNMTSAQLKFKVAYSQLNTASSDLLRVFISNDCGKTWAVRYAKGGAVLSTSPDLHITPFVPTASEWREETIVISGALLTENIRLRFDFRSENGNNLYIDDINIDGAFSKIPLQVFPKDSAIVANNVKLDWKSTRPVDKYEVQWDVNDSFASAAVASATESWIGFNPYNIDTEHYLNGLAIGDTIYWRVRTVNQNGSFNGWSPTWSFVVDRQGTSTAIEEDVSLDEKMRLFPNPASTHINLQVSWDRTGEALLEVFDITGRRVVSKTIHSSAGSQAIPIAISSWQRGMYLVRFTTALKQYKAQFIKQ